MKQRLPLRLFVLFIVLIIVTSLTPLWAQDTPSSSGDTTFARANTSPSPDGDEPLIRPSSDSTYTFDRTVQPASDLNGAQTLSPTTTFDPQARERLDDLVRPVSGPITALILFNRASALEQVPAAQTGAQPLSNSTVSAQVAQQSRGLEAAQSAYKWLLQRGYNLRVIGDLTLTANGIIVQMDASDIESIEALPGVAQVIPDQIGEIGNRNSVPLINAIQVWASGSGYTGQGIRIGIIDSGIDYTHANFGGSGDVSRYTGNDTTTITDAIGYDGSKVVSGYDFVGDTWESGPLAGAGGSIPGTGWTFPNGDNDPLDCNRHGSHVAGTAAGFGVTDGGATYAGPWNDTIDLDALKIGPGVAPEAELFALKIGGCTSAVSFIAAAQALEVAMDPDGDGNPSDHLDVVNNSYGGAFGSPQELLAAQFDVAAKAGVIVVASAGNEGNTFFVTGAPAVSDWAVSVASSVSDTLYGGLEITSGNGAFSDYPVVIAANPSNGGAAGSFGPYSLKLVGGADNAQGCTVDDYAGFDGEAGLIVWTGAASGCGSGTRMTNAVNAGNVAGLVVVSANPGDFPFINLACTYNGGPSPIPCVSITNADGQKLAADPSAFTVRFDSSLQQSLGISLADTVSGFTSRGPRMLGGSDRITLKPDISAPGSGIFSTLSGSGNEGETLSGTSMAGPHVAGAAGLMRQRNPGWDVSEIKALLMNTAIHDLWTDPNQSGDNYPLSRVGAGRLDVLAALNSQVIAYNSERPERVSVSYGLVEVVDVATIARTIIVENKGSSSQTYNISFQDINPVPGVRFTVSPASITVGAGATAQVRVTLVATEQDMDDFNQFDPTTNPTQVGAFGNLSRNKIVEAAGYVVLTPTTATSKLRVPVHSVVRASADMRADGPVSVGQGDAGFALLPLVGNDVNTGTDYPQDVISQVSAFELVYEDAVSQPDELRSGDIQYIGVTSDYLSAFTLCGGNAECAIANTTLYFAISTYGDWSTLNGFDAWFDIGIDSDEDNLYDSTLFNFETGFLISADWTDTVLTYFTDGGSWLVSDGNVLGADGFVNQLPPNVLEMYNYNNSVVMMPVAATSVGLSATNTDFQFDVLSLSSFEIADVLPLEEPLWLTYDVAASPLDFTDGVGFIGGPYLGAPLWDDTDQNIVPVTYALDPSPEPLPQILLLHHHNAKGASVGRAEVVSLERTTQLDGSVLKGVDDDVPTEGDTVIFTISVISNGPGPLDDPIVTDTLPAGLTYVSDTCPGVSTVSGTTPTTITCDLTDISIPVGFQLDFTITATVDAETSGQTLTNTVDLTSNAAMTDVDPSNNTASANVCVDGVAGSCNPMPRIERVTGSNGDTVTDGGTLYGSISALNIAFTQPVLDGNIADGAENENNYRLIMEGDTPGFQMDACTQSETQQDDFVEFSMSYDPSTYVARMTIEGPLPMPPLLETTYRLMVCGTTSIVSTSGVTIDGDGDGIPGGDMVMDFSVASADDAPGDDGEGGEGGEGSGGELLTSDQIDDLIKNLPSTGETPLWRTMLLALGGISLAGIMAWLLRR